MSLSGRATGAGSLSPQSLRLLPGIFYFAAGLDSAINKIDKYFLSSSCKVAIDEIKIAREAADAAVGKIRKITRRVVLIQQVYQSYPLVFFRYTRYLFLMSQTMLPDRVGCKFSGDGSFSQSAIRSSEVVRST